MNQQLSLSDILLHKQNSYNEEEKAFFIQGGYTIWIKKKYFKEQKKRHWPTQTSIVTILVNESENGKTFS